MIETLRQIFAQSILKHCKSIVIPISRKNLGFRFTPVEMKHLTESALRNSAYYGFNDITVYLVSNYLTVFPMGETEEAVANGG